MLFTQAALFAVSTAAVALDATKQASTRSGRRADRYSTIDLDYFDPETNNGTLVEKRFDWRWCARTGNTAHCVSAGAGAGGVAVAIGTLIYTKSQNHDCSYSNAVTNGVQYQVHATGANCDTTAQQNTIEGGLQTYFDDHNGAVCDVHCVQQTHGGTYTGYLLIAPADADINGVICDASVDFKSENDCGEGGKNNVG